MGLSCCLVLEAASCLIASRKCEVPTHAPDSSCARTPYALLGQGPNIVIVASRAGLLVLRTSTQAVKHPTIFQSTLQPSPCSQVHQSHGVGGEGSCWRADAHLRIHYRAFGSCWDGIACTGMPASMLLLLILVRTAMYSYCCCCRSRYWLRQPEPLAPGEIESPEPWTVPFATGHNDLSVQLPAAMGNRQAATPFLFQVGWRDLLRLY